MHKSMSLEYEPSSKSLHNVAISTGPVSVMDTFSGISDPIRDEDSHSLASGRDWNP